MAETTRDIPPETDPLVLAAPGDPRCGHVVGPVWKLDGESWACERPAGHDGHDGDHATADGTWWVHEVCRPEVRRA